MYLGEEKKRMTIGAWIDKAFSMLMVGICSYGVNQMSLIRQELNHVNEKMATVIERTTNQQERINTLEARVQFLERKKP